MNWHNLSNKKKANFLVLGVVALLFVLFILSIVFLNSKNSTLNQELTRERALSHSLTTLQSSVIFPTLSTAKAKKIIRKTYRTFKGKKMHIDKNKHIVLSGSKIQFFKILNGLSALKNKHGIIVIGADIKYVDNGIVGAKLIFSYP